MTIRACTGCGELSTAMRCPQCGQQTEPMMPEYRETGIEARVIEITKPVDCPDCGARLARIDIGRYECGACIAKAGERR